MKQIALKGHLLLRKILTALTIGTVVVTFQACFEVPMVNVRGTIKAIDTKEPIPGILVSIDKFVDAVVISDSYGQFEISVESWDSDRYYDKKILFKDIDGPENGEFKDMEITVLTEVNQYLDILLTRK
jgi:hypothetical protein